MNKLIATIVVLIFIRNQVATQEIDVASYCNICTNHTMCLYTSEYFGANCRKLEWLGLFDEEIEWLLYKHNSLRQNISLNEETGFSMWQNMMQMFWDEELASIAEKWAEQCTPYEQDQCRDVSRFKVLQSVSTIFESDLNATWNSKFPYLRNFLNLPSITMLNHHLEGWFNDGNYLHLKKKVGLTEANGLYNPTVAFVGCSRAIYWVDYSNEYTRAETLVCNYGPLVNESLSIKMIAHECKKYSDQYNYLCIELVENKLLSLSIANVNDTLPNLKDESWRSYDLEGGGGSFFGRGANSLFVRFQYSFLCSLTLCLLFSFI